MTSRAKRILFNVFRVAICLAALGFVAQGVTLDDHVLLEDGVTELVGAVTQHDGAVLVDLSDGSVRTLSIAEIARDEDGVPRIDYGLRTSLRTSRKDLLFLALLIHFPVVFLQAIRLALLLRVQGIHLSLWQSIKVSFAGNFMNFATPLGSNAGDVFKAYFVTTHTDQKTEAATTIVLDRIVGLGTLILSVALITTLVRGDGRLAEVRPYVLGVLGAGVAATFAYLSPGLRRLLMPSKWLSRLPLFAHLLRVDRAARTLAGHWAIVSLAVLLTAMLQVLAVTAYFSVAVALGLDAHAGNVLEYYACFYTGTVIQALPGPPQGLGTVELAYRYFLAPFGSPSQIVCMAFLIRFVVLTCALPGLLVTVTGSYKPRDPVGGPDRQTATDARRLPDATLPTITDPVPTKVR